MVLYRPLKNQRPSKEYLDDGGRYRIRTYDFHRVNLNGLGFTTTYKTVETA